VFVLPTPISPIFFLPKYYMWYSLHHVPLTDDLSVVKWVHLQTLHLVTAAGSSPQNGPVLLLPNCSDLLVYQVAVLLPISVMSPPR